MPVDIASERPDVHEMLFIQSSTERLEGISIFYFEYMKFNTIFKMNMSYLEINYKNKILISAISRMLYKAM